MRLARSQPELPGNGCFPPLLYRHLETSLEPALPAILTHKDEGASGNVTRPGGWQPGRPAHNRRVESWPRSIVRVLPRVCEVDTFDEDLE